MSADLGKDDVVEAINDMQVAALWTPPGVGDYQIAAGQRAIVVEVMYAAGFCTRCGHQPDAAGLVLAEYPLIARVRWCPCEWKKIGGSKADHVSQFAQHLKGVPVRAIPILTPDKRVFRRLITEKP
jgi:hypothetical protein